MKRLGEWIVEVEGVWGCRRKRRSEVVIVKWEKEKRDAWQERKKEYYVNSLS